MADLIKLHERYGDEITVAVTDIKAMEFIVFGGGSDSVTSLWFFDGHSINVNESLEEIQEMIKK